MQREVLPRTYLIGDWVNNPVRENPLGGPRADALVPKHPALRFRLNEEGGRWNPLTALPTVGESASSDAPGSPPRALRRVSEPERRPPVRTRATNRLTQGAPKRCWSRSR